MNHPKYRRIDLNVMPTEMQASAATITHSEKAG